VKGNPLTFEKRGNGSEKRGKKAKKGWKDLNSALGSSVLAGIDPRRKRGISYFEKGHKAKGEKNVMDVPTHLEDTILKAKPE